MKNRISIELAGKLLLVSGLETDEIAVALTVPGVTHVNGKIRGLPDAVNAAIHAANVKVVHNHKPLTSTLDEGTVKQYGLRPFQSSGAGTLVARLSKYGGAILADDMGLGKTRQAIVASELLGSKRTLIACPGSVRDQWVREIKALLPKATPVALFPVATKRDRRAWRDAETASHVVVSYELLDRTITHCFEFDYPNMLILDEFHQLSGRKTQRSLLVGNISQMCRYVLGLTGSPIWDTPRNLWKQLDIIVKGKFGTSYAFDVRYCGGRQGEYGFDNRGVSNPEELKERLAHYMVRREKREVAKDLPAVSMRTVWVPPTEKARAAFESTVLAPATTSAYEALKATLEDKMDATVELATSCNNCIVFTREKKHARELAQRIARTGKETHLITGDTSRDERKTIIGEAAKTRSTIVATIDSVGVGVDGLQHVTSTAIHHWIDPTPEKIAQANARLDRIGQTEPVDIIFVAMKDTMDEVTVGINISKIDKARAILGGDAKHRHAFDNKVTPEDEVAAMRELIAALNDRDSDDSEDDE